MIGPLTVGKKAAKFGYRRFGKTGAVVFGVGSVGGYYFAKRKAKSLMSKDANEMSVEESLTDTGTEIDMTSENETSSESEDTTSDSESNE